MKLNDVPDDWKRDGTIIGVVKLRTAMAEAQGGRFVPSEQSPGNLPFVVLPSADGGSLAVWLDGFGPEPPGLTRPGKLLDLWAQFILPELVKAANSSVEREEVHAEALRVSHKIDVELERVNRSVAKGDSPIGWEDLVAGPLVRAVPKSGEWLARVRGYAESFAGTDPVNGGPIAVTLAVEAYPRKRELWFHRSAQEIEMQPDSRASLRFDYPVK
jgi:hypothetical protein